MIVEGKFNKARVYGGELDLETKDQIINLLDQEFIKDSKIRIMPDVHKGMGCVIGFTGDMKDKIVPNLIGKDIGCGMLTIKLGRVDIDLKNLDRIINEEIPSGKNVHNKIKEEFKPLEDLKIYKDLRNIERIKKSIGSLGGGNHFIELGKDSKGDKYLVIHSGSRNLGDQVASYYQNLAIDLETYGEDYILEREKLIEETKASKLRKELKKLKNKYEGKSNLDYPKNLCFLTGKYREDYLHDMKICQDYASRNRYVIARIIITDLLEKSLEDFSYFETIHNYIDFRDNIVRKGAISAYEGEEVLIPINMKDGSILARGKGNEDWNNSAPHGAGRLKSRKEARESYTLNKFKKDMEGIYTTSLRNSTLDENPSAYKPMDYILSTIGDTVDIVDIIKPIYNFKDS